MTTRSSTASRKPSSPPKPATAAGRGFGAIATPRIPNTVIDEIAASLAPVLRQAARDAARELHEARQEAPR